MNRLALSPIALVALVALAAPSLAQSVRPDALRQEVDRLRAENAVLRQELRSIKTIVDGVQAKLAERPRPPLASSAPSLKIGVVDIGTLFKGYARKAVYEKEINKTRKAMKARVTLSHQKIKDCEELFAKLAPSERIAMRENYEARRSALMDRSKTLQSEMEAVLKSRVSAMTIAILKEIEKAVETYALRHGYDLVLKADGSRGFGEETADEVIFRNQINTILFRNESSDLTEAVLQTLNVPVADWFEPGPLSRVVYVLEQAGVSFSGRRFEGDLIIDCRLAETSLAAVARIRDSLRGASIARYYRVMQKNSGVVVRAEPQEHMRFEICLEGWKGLGAERFQSLDRLIAADPSGVLALAVKSLESVNFEVRGRSGKDLHVSIYGAHEVLVELKREGLEDLGFNKIGLRSALLLPARNGGGRLELTLTAPALKERSLRIEHHPVERPKVSAEPGANRIQWAYSPRSCRIVVTEVVVEVAVGQSKDWSRIATLPVTATACMHEVVDRRARRYRVATRAKVDEDDPRLRGRGFTLNREHRQQVSPPSEPVTSLPALCLIPLNVGQAQGQPGWAWIRIHKFDQASRIAMPDKAFRVKVGGEIGGLLKSNGRTRDYRTGATLVRVRTDFVPHKGGGETAVGVATIRWANGKEIEVRSTDSPPLYPAPR